MPAQRIHLVRHGEVYNPSGVLYGRLPNFHLSDTGKLMAEAAALELKSAGFDIKGVFSSPLVRAQESAKPIEALFGLDAKTNEDLIEPWNVFEGRKLSLVTHQLPIWVMHLHAAGEKLMHDPRKRRCSLSSITSFELVDGKLTEISYLEPAKSLLAVDRGAV